MPRAENRVTLADESDALGLPRARVTFAMGDNEKRMKAHARRFMGRLLEEAGGYDPIETGSTAHLMGGCRMGHGPGDSVTNANGRTWDVPNLWICDDSLMPTGGGVNPSMTVMANAIRIAGRIRTLAGQGVLEGERA
jgi:choline dehydrogenase-like flavoprotein